MIWRSVVLVALLSLVAGCASRPTKHIYVLEDAVDPTADPQAAVTLPELRLRRVLVPDYLDTTDIRERVGEHEVRSSSTARWGERLSLGMTHALRADLADRLPMYAVRLSGPPEKLVGQLLVNVEAFEVWPDGHCALAANWTLLKADGGAVLSSGRKTLSVPPVVGGDSEDRKVVTGTAAAVSRLADAIASAVSASLSPPSQAR